ncbi:hypothetical protein ABRZ04_05175 [Castellaniella ginsengisoli]|uniref:Uncharacterized protein n=1 Tax=Castellaniella ginsengisoli TaxID=546114 RepID=A0AB39D2E2_9BURK
MSYAIQNDGLGWRAVNGPDDVGPDETYSETAPAPVPEPQPHQPRTILSSREYLTRFTNAEYAAVRAAESIDLQRAYDSLIAAQYVDLTDPAVGMGLDMMVSLGIIDATRKAELLQPEPA